MNSANVGGVVSVPSEWVKECSKDLVCASSAIMVAVVSFISSPLSITSQNLKFVSRSLLLLPIVDNRHRASAVWFLTPAQFTTSKSNSDRRNMSLPIPSALFKIHCKLWSVRMVSRVLSRYGHERSTDQTIAKHSHRVIL